MLTAWYRGDHSDDALSARLGYRLIRIGQTREVYGQYTHVEAIHGGTWNDATIASASVRDGRKVRIEKHVRLNPLHWDVVEVPLWSLVQSVDWFREHRGEPYSMLGAAASAAWPVRAVLGLARVEIASLGTWCSRAVGESAGIVGAVDMSVAELAAVAFNLPGSEDVSKNFFKGADRG